MIIPSAPAASKSLRGGVSHRSKLISFGTWLFCTFLLAVAALEFFCFLFPIRRICRPFLNRLFISSECAGIIQTNSLGMRENSEIPPVKPAAEKRIFLVGDSFVFGYNLNQRNTLCAQLQKNLGNPARVLNAGSDGTGPLQYAHCVRNLAVPLGTDIAVVFFYIGNDLDNTWEPSVVFPHNLKNYLKVFVPNAYLWAFGWKFHRKLPWRETTPQPVRLDPWEDQVLYRWAKRDGLSKDEMDARRSGLSVRGKDWITKRVVNPSYFYLGLIHPAMLQEISTLGNEGYRAGMRQCQRIFSKMHRRCKKSGVRLLLVSVPASWQVNEEQWGFWKTLGFQLDPSLVLQDQPQKEMDTFCRREGIEHLDLLPVLRANPSKRMYFHWDEHWRPGTVRYVAEFLGKYFRDSGHIP